MSNIDIHIEKDDSLIFLDNVTGEVQKAENAALRAAAAVVRNRTRKELQSTGINLHSAKSKYNDSLLDAVRISKPQDEGIKVHVMGSRAKDSGTFRLRFFECGTKVRYAKTYKGKALEKPHKTGAIRAYHFFSKAIESSDTEVQNAISKTLVKYTDKWNNG